MSDDLSYLSLRAVLEYLDPNKRVHIAARSPAIRDFERSVPIHFGYLGVGKDGFYSNNIVIQLISGVEWLRRNNPLFIDDDLDLIDGEVHFGSEESMRQQKFVQVSFENDVSKAEIHQRLPNGLNIREASRTLARVLLGYKKIYANLTRFEGSLHNSVVRTPANIKIRTKFLDISNNDLEDCLKLIDSSSFPLNQFALIVRSTPTLFHPLVHSSELLVISESKIALNLDVLQRLPNKHVEVHRMDFPEEAIIRLIEQWGRGTAKSFVLRVSGEEFVKNLSEEINDKFGGEFRSLNKEEIPYCVSLPVSATSELNIYGFRNDEGIFIAIEEHPIGTSTPFSAEPNVPSDSILPMIIRGFMEKPKSVERFKEKVRGPVIFVILIVSLMFSVLYLLIFKRELRANFFVSFVLDTSFFKLSINSE